MVIQEVTTRIVSKCRKTTSNRVYHKYYQYELNASSPPLPSAQQITTHHTSSPHIPYKAKANAAAPTSPITPAAKAFSDLAALLDLVVGFALAALPEALA